MLKWIEIDLSAVAENCRLVKKLLNPGVRFQAVVKADGYGHGAVEVARTALREAADSLGVLTVEEAAALRKADIRSPIHLLAPPLPDEAEDAAALDLVPAVDSGSLLEALDRAARKPLLVTVDLDFGLGRWGIQREDLSRFLKTLSRFKRLRLAGLSAHLDYVPDRNAVEAEEKLRSFAACVRAAKNSHSRVAGRAALSSRGRRPRTSLAASVANSSILLDFPHWQMDGVRIGNLLYGINPTARPLPLQNPWRFFARLISIREVRKGSALGYGSEYLAPRRMRVASIPAGYADGLTMEPVERLIGLGKGYRYWGLLNDREAPFIGRCGISHALLDVSAVPSAKVGDAVLLPVRRTAANARIPRLYKR